MARDPADLQNRMQDGMEMALEPREFGNGTDRQRLIDPFGRAISYLRVSVTDRCDFRCVYCMAEDMSFRAGCASFASPAASPWCGAAS